MQRVFEMYVVTCIFISDPAWQFTLAGLLTSLLLTQEYSYGYSAGFAPHTRGQHHSSVKKTVLDTAAAAPRLILYREFRSQSQLPNSSHERIRKLWIKCLQHYTVFMLKEKRSCFPEHFGFRLRWPSMFYSLSKVLLQLHLAPRVPNIISLFMDRVTDCGRHSARWLFSYTGMNARVDKESWFTAANMRGERSTTSYRWIEWEIYGNTFVHKWKNVLSFNAVLR